MKKVILFASLYFIILANYAQTYINYPITSNTTWSLSGSPYIVTTNSGVFSGVTLIIEPGVTVQFNTNITFVVKGLLLAHGTINDSITFTSSSSNPQMSSWKGIGIQNDQGGRVDFNYCRGFYADEFIRVLSNSNTFIIKIRNSRFKQNNFVLYLRDYSLSNYLSIIDSCSFEHNSYVTVFGTNIYFSNSYFHANTKGIHGWGPPTVYIYNCTFSGSGLFTLNLSGTVIGCTFKGNAECVRLRDDIILKDNIFINNYVAIEIVSVNPIPVQNVSGNYICNNTINVKHTTWVNVDLSNNCWCSFDETYVSSKIIDAYDNMTLGIVNFSPFDNDCDLNIPTLVEDKYEVNSTINIYPVPTKDILVINSEKEIIGEIKMFDVGGKLIHQESIKDNYAEIDVKDLKAGIYFIEIEGAVGKFVKE